MRCPGRAAGRPAPARAACRASGAVRAPSRLRLARRARVRSRTSATSASIRSRRCAKSSDSRSTCDVSTLMRRSVPGAVVGLPCNSRELDKRPSITQSEDRDGLRIQVHPDAREELLEFLRRVDCEAQRGWRRGRPRRGPGRARRRAGAAGDRSVPEGVAGEPPGRRSAPDLAPSGGRAQRCACRYMAHASFRRRTRPARADRSRSRERDHPPPEGNVRGHARHDQGAGAGEAREPDRLGRRPALLRARLGRLPVSAARSRSRRRTRASTRAPGSASTRPRPRSIARSRRSACAASGGFRRCRLGSGQPGTRATDFLLGHGLVLQITIQLLPGLVPELDFGADRKPANSASHVFRRRGRRRARWRPGPA